MSTIRIYSKKTFAIGPGASKNTDVIENFLTVPGSFQDMPEIYKYDPTFLLAVKAHEIEIINKPTVSGYTQSNTVNDVDSFESEENKYDPLEEYKEKLKGMNSEEVKEEAEKYNAKFVEEDQLKVNKKRVFEAFKLSLNANNDKETSDPDSE